jgi:hypothetical protein
MKILLVSSALAAASFFAPAFAQQVTPSHDSTVEGHAAVQLDQPAPDQAVAPKPKTSVTIETDVEQTTTAKVETRKETIVPVSDRPALNPENPIAPEVAAVATSGRKYTTQDIVLAQLEAIKNTPITEPTTTITTTTTTPAPG